MNKKFFLVVLLLFGFVVSVNASSAYMTNTSTRYYFSTYDLPNGNWSYTKRKIIGGNDAYCTEEYLTTSSGTVYTSSLNNSEANLVFAGKALDVINEEFSSKSDAYKYTWMTAIMNSYNRKALGNSSAYNFYDKSSKVKSIYDQIKRDTDEIMKAKINKGALKVGNSSMNSLGRTSHISNKISITNLTNKILGSNVTYTLSVATKGGGTPSICTDSSGKQCSGTSKTITGKTSDNFYVKVDNGTVNTIVTISLSGKASVTYPKLTYYHMSNSRQDVIRNDKSTRTKNYTSSTIKLNLTFDKSSLAIYKYDESGNDINDANFTMTLDGNNVPLTKNNNYFSSGELALSISGKTLCYTETKIPNGFKKPENVTTCVTIPTSDTANACFDASGTQIDDTKYCDNYVYMCVAENGYKDLESGNCNYPKSLTKVCTLKNENTYTDQTETTECDNATENYTYMCKKEDGTYENLGEDGNCGTETVTDNTKKKCVVSNSNNTYTVGDNKYCDANSADYTKLTYNSNSLVLSVYNDKNSVTISKKAITGDNEVAGAKLKICSKTDYESKKNECTAITDISGDKVEWVSTNEAATVSGVPSGEYYIVETVPPLGYVIATTATPFSIDKNGVVTASGATVSDKIVVNNSLTNITISKTDIATSKELPGAKLTICETTYNRQNRITSDGSTDEESSASETTNNTDNNTEEEPVGEDTYEGMLKDADGECVPALLYDGTEASWTSSDKPKVISGLPAGTYYLVEKAAPNGYSTSEAIVFKMNADGTLSDKDGKSLANNKIVMKDAPIKDVKTGMLPILLASIIALSSLAVLYYYNSLKKVKKI